MTSTSPEPDDETLPDDPIEERRSRLLGIVRLFGGMLLVGAIAAAVVALAVVILVKIGPDLVVVEPGTTPISTPSPTVSSEPEPIETLTRLPSSSAGPTDQTGSPDPTTGASRRSDSSLPFELQPS